jgi:hypothetical protein
MPPRTSDGWRSTLDVSEHLFDTGRVGYVEPKPHWEAGRQAILNDRGARKPAHTFDLPVPVVARVVWAEDGEEYIETEAAGWTGRDVYVRLPDSRHRLTSVWLDASDVKRR